MADTPHQYCHACDKLQPVDDHWRAFWIDQGHLTVSDPLDRDFNPRDYEYMRKVTAFACGQGSALVLVERFLHSGSFDAVQIAPPAAQPLTEISNEQGATRP